MTQEKRIDHDHGQVFASLTSSTRLEQTQRSQGRREPRETM